MLLHSPHPKVVINTIRKYSWRDNKTGFFLFFFFRWPILGEYLQGHRECLLVCCFFFLKLISALDKWQRKPLEIVLWLGLLEYPLFKAESLLVTYKRSGQWEQKSNNLQASSRLGEAEVTEPGGHTAGPELPHTRCLHWCSTLASEGGHPLVRALPCGLSCGFWGLSMAYMVLVQREGPSRWSAMCLK